MGSITALNKHPGRPAMINEMSAELQAILARVRTVEQQSAFLAEQIAIRAERQDFLTAALHESQTVASEISSSAEQRINSLQARAQSIMAPQQDQIAELILEISRLESEAEAQSAEDTAPDIPADLKLAPLSHHFDNVIDLTAYLHLPLHQETNENTARSGIETEADSLGGQRPVPTDTIAGADNKEPAATPDPPASNPAANGTVSAIPDEEKACDSQSVVIDESQVEPAGDHSAAAAAEILQFDTEISVYHIHSGESWPRPKHRHHWKLALQVEVPEDNVDVVYIHIAAAIAATLARFDGTLLNRVFPFDLIEPSHENIAAYFFNLLEDTLVLKELILRELALVENDTPQMTIDTRSTEIEEMLKGEDLIQDIRTSLLDKSKNGQVAADQPAKKKFGFFKK